LPQAQHKATSPTRKPLAYIGIKSKMKEIAIYNQIWSAENLDVSTYRNGDSIPEVQSPEEWKELKTGAWCYFENDSNNNKYGKIYNWFALNDPRGLAPIGYKIASHYDWLKLGENLGGSWNALEKLISLNFFDLYAGYRDDFGQYGYWNNSIGWWTNSEVNANNHNLWALTHFLIKEENGILWKPFDKKSGFYVRCIRQQYEKVKITFDSDLSLSISSLVYKFKEDTTFQDLLNYLYSSILKEKVSMNSYGQQWIIEKFDGERLEKINKENKIDNRKLFYILNSFTAMETIELICKRK
jgi:uncharacterized protein (TIGR02145 family)